MYFPITRGLFRRKVGEVKAVDDVSFHIRKGETMGLVGESGCGKTTVGRCILRIYQPTGGKINFNGQDISKLPENNLNILRRQMQLIFQDPYASLDPRQSAGSIVGEPLLVHQINSRNHEYQNRLKS
jgi:ABC-type oligopeptide transport system ATPase subunit